MTQLVELQANTADIESAGIGVAAILYDDQKTLDRFVRKYRISYTVISDEGSPVITALGLLNTEIDPTSPYHGVPYPGVFLLDADGKVFARFAEQNYRERPLLDDILAAIDRLTRD